MTLVVTGISHKTVSTDRLGDFRVNPDDLENRLRSLSDRYSGLAILSTCNRTEIYVDAEGETPTPEEMRSLLSELSDSGSPLSGNEAYTHVGIGAIGHLIRVATGLESAIVGEPHIVGQISDAFSGSVDLGVSSPALTELFHHAIRANRRIRRSAGMNAKPPSISSLAITAAENQAGGYRGKSVFTIGAGEIGEEIALGIQQKDVDAHFIASRTFQNAERLSARTGAYPIVFSQIINSLVAIDMLFTCTSSKSPILTRESLEEVMSQRLGQPLVIVDLAVPGDVEAGSSEIDGITLISIDELQKLPPGQRASAESIKLAEDLVNQEAANFDFSDEIGPSEAFVRELAMFAENIRRSELERTASRLDSLAPAESLAIELMTKSIIKRVLAGPIQYAKRQGDRESIRMAAEPFGITLDTHAEAEILAA